jgi:plasmid stabilization system protein ParE
MARVEVALAAIEDLDRLIRVLSLPRNTRERVRRTLLPLARFPRLGPELHARWAGFRFLLGPWRWMLIVYAYVEGEDRVIVVTIQDARAGDSPTVGR